MPATAGPIAAPAMAVAICEAATGQKPCESRMIAEARTVQMPGMMTKRRLREVASISAPAGAVMIMPATPPRVITVPINPLSQ